MEDQYKAERTTPDLGRSGIYYGAGSNTPFKLSEIFNNDGKFGNSYTAGLQFSNLQRSRSQGMENIPMETDYPENKEEEGRMSTTKLAATRREDLTSSANWDDGTDVSVSNENNQQFVRGMPHWRQLLNDPQKAAQYLSLQWPRISLRASYKRKDPYRPPIEDEEDEEITPEKEEDKNGCRFKTVCLIILGFILVASAAIPIFIVLALTEDSGSTVYVKATMTLTVNGTYTAELGNLSSREFQMFGNQFCSEITQIYKNWSLNEYFGCRITNLRSGSIIVIFVVYFTNTQLQHIDDNVKQVLVTGLSSGYFLGSFQVVFGTIRVISVEAEILSTPPLVQGLEFTQDSPSVMPEMTSNIYRGESSTQFQEVFSSIMSQQGSNSLQKQYETNSPTFLSESVVDNMTTQQVNHTRDIVSQLLETSITIQQDFSTLLEESQFVATIKLNESKSMVTMTTAITDDLTPILSTPTFTLDDSKSMHSTQILISADSISSLMKTVMTDDSTAILYATTSVDVVPGLTLTSNDTLSVLSMPTIILSDFISLATTSTFSSGDAISFLFTQTASEVPSPTLTLDVLSTQKPMSNGSLSIMVSLTLIPDSLTSVESSSTLISDDEASIVFTLTPVKSDEIIVFTSAAFISEDTTSISPMQTIISTDLSSLISTPPSFTDHQTTINATEMLIADDLTSIVSMPVITLDAAMSVLSTQTTMLDSFSLATASSNLIPDGSSLIDSTPLLISDIETSLFFSVTREFGDNTAVLSTSGFISDVEVHSMKSLIPNDLTSTISTLPSMTDNQVAINITTILSTEELQSIVTTQIRTLDDEMSVLSTQKIMSDGSIMASSILISDGSTLIDSTSTLTSNNETTEVSKSNDEISVPSTSTLMSNDFTLVISTPTFKLDDENSVISAQTFISDSLTLKYISSTLRSDDNTPKVFASIITDDTPTLFTSFIYDDAVSVPSVPTLISNYLTSIIDSTLSIADSQITSIVSMPILTSDNAITVPSMQIISDGSTDITTMSTLLEISTSFDLTSTLMLDGTNSIVSTPIVITDSVILEPFSAKIISDDFIAINSTPSFITDDLISIVTTKVDTDYSATTESDLSTLYTTSSSGFMSSSIGFDTPVSDILISCKNIQGQLYSGPTNMTCIIGNVTFEKIAVAHENGSFAAELYLPGSVNMITPDPNIVPIFDGISTFVVMFLNISCNMNGTYTIALLDGTNNSSASTEAELFIFDPPEEPTLILNPDQVIDIVFQNGTFYREGREHSCESNVGFPPGNLTIDIRFANGTDFQNISTDMLKVTSETNSTMACQNRKKINFAIRFTNDMVGATLRCRIPGAETIVSGVLKTLTLIPRNICSCAVAGNLTAHPTRCDAFVTCTQDTDTNIYPLGIACGDAMCNNSTTGICSNGCSNDNCIEQPTDFCTSTTTILTTSTTTMP